MNLYKVTLNWYGEIHILLTQAYSQAQALANARARLAEELGKSRYSVRQYYLDGKDRYEVKEVR